MEIKELIEKEKKFAKFEYHVKIKAEIEDEQLHSIGAKEIGTVVHEDRYYHAHNKIIRIRKEGEGNLTFTYKDKDVISKKIGDKDVAEICKGHKKILTINKQRTFYILGSIVIAVDKVENMGKFIEFQVDSENKREEIDILIGRLGLENEKEVDTSYLHLARELLNKHQMLLSFLAENFGKYSFGISGAVLTTLGVTMGLVSTTSSVKVIIGGIISIAAADSMADAMGMYATKKAERGVSNKTAINCAKNVFLSKVFFTLSFAIPYLLFPLGTAMIVAIIWGLILISFMNIIIAFMQEEHLGKAVLKYVTITGIVLTLSRIVGKLVDAYFK